ncbi:MAG: hypothetical protein JNM88_03110 [Chitinophagaceae bacterium]|nr:hypothetical protein [Chitinophagaceae bacterium]
MKRATLVIILLATMTAVFSQETGSRKTTLTKQEYLQKSKAQKTGAWILLGTGVTCLLVAAPGKVDLDLAGILIAGGGLSIVGSIPLFIASAKNKKRAMAATAFLDLQKLQPIAGRKQVYIPGITVRVGF